MFQGSLWALLISLSYSWIFSVLVITLLAAEPEEKTVIGYVLAVKNKIKNSKKSNKPYFNIDLETQKDVKSVVCFSPSKHRLFETAANERTGCEIKNVSIKDDKTVFVSDYSTLCTKELGFQEQTCTTFTL